MKSWIDKKESYFDKDCWIEFNLVGNTMFSISRTHRGMYFVQITEKGLFFNTDSIEMAYNVVKNILIKEV